MNLKVGSLRILTLKNLQQTKKNKRHASNIRNESGDMSIDLTETKMNIRKYYEELYATQKFR